MQVFLIVFKVTKGNLKNKKKKQKQKKNSLIFT